MNSRNNLLNRISLLENRLSLYRKGEILMKESIGSTIKKYRKNAKLTQKQLAEKLDKAESTVRMWELEKSTPSIDTINKIAEILNISVLELLQIAKEKDAERSDYMKTIGAIIREVRLSKGLTLMELAKLSGVSNPFISQIENDKHKPSLESLDALAKALNIPFFDLLRQIGYGESQDEYVANLERENAKLRKLVDELAGDVAEFTAITLRKVKNLQ